MFSFFGGGPPPTHFEQQLRAYSVLFLPGANRESVDQGGKIILPPSALERLAHLNIQYPMLFKLGNERADRTTHAGVLEFVAEEGRAYLPHWMMQNLLLNEGDIINITNASLRSANYSKFQPQTANFLDISNPKAVLENTLRGFACLTEGDIIAIPYNNKVYEIAVLEVKPKDPSHAVSIIECDMQLEFEKPLDYVEPDYKAMAAEEKARKAAEEAARAQEEVKAEVEKAIEASTAETKAFSGTAFRLDGKPVTSSDESAAAAAASASTSTSSTASGDSAAAARRKSQNVLAEAAAARRARAAAQAAVAEQRYTPGKLSFSSGPARPASASTADAKKTASSSSAASSASSSSSNAPPASSGFEAFKGTAHKLR